MKQKNDLSLPISTGIYKYEYLEIDFIQVKFSKSYIFHL